MSISELQRERATRAGLIAFAIVFVLAFPWVNSEWKGGWLQAIGGASLLAVPAGLLACGLRASSASKQARLLLRALLLVTVLLSLAGVYSYGIFTTPWLLAPLWITARRGGPRERYLWIALAMPCALLVGWLLSSSFDHRVTGLPALFTLTVLLLFVVSTRPSFHLAFAERKKCGKERKLGQLFLDGGC